MALDIGRSISGAGRFYGGFQEGQQQQMALEEQRLRLDALRRQEEAARRQAETARQAGAARGEMLGAAPSYELGERMGTAAAPQPQPQPEPQPQPKAGVQTPQAETTGERRKPRPRDTGAGGADTGQVRTELTADERTNLTSERERLQNAISEGYRLVYEREGRGTDTTGTRERISQLEQQLKNVDARLRGESVTQPETDEPLTPREYPRAAGRMVGEAARGTLSDLQTYLYDPFVESYKINERLFLQALGVAGEGLSGAYQGFTGQEASSVTDDEDTGISEEEMADIDRRIQERTQSEEAQSRENPELYAQAETIFEENREDIAAVNPNATVEDVYQSLLNQRGEPTSEQRQRAESEVTAESEQVKEQTRQRAGLSEEDDVIDAPVNEGLTDAYVEGIEGQQRVGVDTQRLLQERENLSRLAQINAQSGTPEGNAKFDEYYNRINEIDSRLRYLQGMQGINDLRMRNDPRRIAAVWSDYAGNQIQLQPRQDGQYNIFVEGQLTQEGVSQDQIVSAAKLAFSEEARNQLAESQAARAETQQVIAQARGEAMAEARGEAYGAYLTQDIDRAMERVQQSGVQETVEGPNGEQVVIYKDESGRLQARQFVPGRPAQESGIFGGGGAPAQPPQFGPVQGLGGGGQAGFNQNLLMNWNQ